MSAIKKSKSRVESSISRPKSSSTQTAPKKPTVKAPTSSTASSDRSSFATESQKDESPATEGFGSLLSGMEENFRFDDADNKGAFHEPTSETVSGGFETPIDSEFKLSPGGFSGTGLIATLTPAKPQSVEEAQEAGRAEIDGTPVLKWGGENPDASVAVIDHFMPAMGGTPHGEQVTSVLTGAGGVDESRIQKLHVGPTSSFASQYLLSQDGPGTPSERLNGFIEMASAEPLQRFNKVLEGIANDPDSQIHTINSSNAVAKIQTFTRLLDLALQTGEGGEFQLTETGERIFEGLGLEPNASPENLRLFAERAVERVDLVTDSSPLIQDEVARHTDLSERLAEDGVTYVISAGNYADDIAPYREMGIMPDGFDDNLMSNKHNIVIGSTNDNGTASPMDDSISSFSSVDPEVDFYASGENIDVGHGQSVSGTSFSAPLAAGRLAQLREENFDLDTYELWDLAKRQGVQVSGVDRPVLVGQQSSAF